MNVAFHGPRSGCASVGLLGVIRFNRQIRECLTLKSSFDKALVAGDFVHRESDGREEALRGAAFHPDELNHLKYNPKDWN